MKIFVVLCNMFYGIVSVVLIGIALTLIAFALWEAGHIIIVKGSPIRALLDAIGLVVISMAVLDVGKYLMEEEVIRERELRSPIEARETLTKFMVIICIAVSLEAVVFISRAGDSADLSALIYPAILLTSAVAIMVGLGIYQKMSGAIEAQDKRQRPLGGSSPTALS